MNRLDIENHLSLQHRSERLPSCGRLPVPLLSSAIVALTLWLISSGLATAAGQTTDLDGTQIVDAQTDRSDAQSGVDPSLPHVRQPLTWRLESGRQYRVVMERILTQKVSDAEWTETIQYDQLWTVDEVTDAAMRLSQTMDSVVHSIEFANGVAIRYDSTQPGDPRGDATVLARFWANRLKSRRSILMDSQGRRVPDITSDSEKAVPTNAPNAEATSKSNAAAATAAAVPSSAPATATTKPTAAPTPAANSSGDWSATFIDLLDADWALPKREWTTGDTWSDAKLVSWNSVAEALRLSASYRYLGEETVSGKSLDKIEVTMAWEDLTPADTLENFAIDRQLGVGTIYFDSTAGYLVSSERDQQLVISLTGSNGEPTRVDVSSRISVRFQPVETEVRPELEVTADP